MGFDKLPDVVIEITISFLNIFDIEQISNLFFINKKLKSFLTTFIHRFTLRLCRNYYSLLHFPSERSIFDVFRALVVPAIIVIAGSQDSRRCDIIYPSKRSFRKCCGLSLKRTQDFDAIFHKGLVFVVSSSEDSAISTVEAYDYFKNKWELMPSLPNKVKNVACVSHDGRLYVIGGYDTNFSTRSSCCSFFNDQNVTLNSTKDEARAGWLTSEMRLLSGRSHHSAISFDGMIWIVGGLIQGQPLTTDTTEIFFPDLNTVTSGPSTIKRRCEPRLLVLKSFQHNNKLLDLYAVGGDIDGVNPVIGTIERYDRQTKQWGIVTTYPRKRSGATIFALDDYNICVCGGMDSGSYLKSCDCYDIRLDRWSSISFDSEGGFDTIIGRRNGMKLSLAVPITPQKIDISKLLGH